MALGVATVACAPSLSYTSPFAPGDLRTGRSLLVSELCSQRRFVVVVGRLVKVPQDEPSDVTWHSVAQELKAADVTDVGLWSNCKITDEGVCAINSGLAAGGVSLMWMHTPSATLASGHIINVPELCGRR
jgi:hypothetical protein